MKVGTYLSEEFEVNIGVHQGYILLLLLLAVVIDVSTNKIQEVTLQEILHAEEIVQIAETIVELQKNSKIGKEHMKVKASK